MDLALSSNFLLQPLHSLLSSESLVVGLPQSQRTFIVEKFNWYFVAVAFGGHILKSVWMVALLGYDPLFTILVAIFWLVPPTFNVLFLVGDDSFKLNIVENHMWVLWTLSFVQILLIIVDWQFQQGDFAKHFKIPINISSVFIAGVNIMNYLLQSGL